MKKLSEKHLRTIMIWVAVLGVLALFVALVAIPSLKRAAIAKAKEELFKTTYSFPENGLITAKNGSNQNKENSLLYVKAALQDGVQCIEVDVCFNSEGKPYIAKSAEEIGENTMPLEYLISFICEESMYENAQRHYINLHLCDASNLEEIDRIIKSYDMLDYCFLTGVNINQAKFVRTSCDVDFYLDYELDKNRAKDTSYMDIVLNDLSLSGAVGINCNVDGFSMEFSRFLKENWFKISFRDVEDELDIITAISYSPDQIITSNPEYALSILLEWHAKAPSSDIIY